MASRTLSNLERCRQAAIKAIREYKDTAFVEHEIEELLYKLSQVDDKELNETARREMERIRAISQGRCFFDLK